MPTKLILELFLVESGYPCFNLLIVYVGCWKPVLNFKTKESVVLSLINLINNLILKNIFALEFDSFSS